MAVGDNRGYVTQAESIADIFNVIGSLILRHKEAAFAKQMEMERMGIERSRLAIQRDQANWERLDRIAMRQLQREQFEFTKETERRKLAQGDTQIRLAMMERMAGDVTVSSQAHDRAMALAQQSKGEYDQYYSKILSSQGDLGADAWVQDETGTEVLVDARLPHVFKFAKGTLLHKVWDSNSEKSKRAYGSQDALVAMVTRDYYAALDHLATGGTVTILVPGPNGDKYKKEIPQSGVVGPSDFDKEELIRGLACKYAWTDGTRREINSQEFGMYNFIRHLDPAYAQHGVVKDRISESLQRQAEVSATIHTYYSARAGQFDVLDPRAQASVYNRAVTNAVGMMSVSKPEKSMLYRTFFGETMSDASNQSVSSGPDLGDGDDSGLGTMTIGSDSDESGDQSYDDGYTTRWWDEPETSKLDREMRQEYIEAGGDEQWAKDYKSNFWRAEAKYLKRDMKNAGRFLKAWGKDVASVPTRMWDMLDMAGGIARNLLTQRDEMASNMQSAITLPPTPDTTQAASPDTIRKKAAAPVPAEVPHPTMSLFEMSMPDTSKPGVASIEPDSLGPLRGRLPLPVQATPEKTGFPFTRKPDWTQVPTKGLNFKSPGAPVTASADGEVEYVGGDGTIVVRYADGYRMVYQGVIGSSVSRGQSVLAGEQIGTSSETTHVEVRAPGRDVPAQDPWKFFNFE